MEKDFDKDFVEHVVKALVDNPDKAEVTKTIDERGVLIELKVDPTDMGKVIGKEGQTAKAIRTLLRVVGAKHNARVNFKIDEPEGSVKPEKPVSEEVKEEEEPKTEPASTDAIQGEEATEEPEEEKSDIEKELGV